LNDRFMADGARAGGQLFEELSSRRYASNDATTHVRANDIGRFRVSPHRRELLADGRPISLGERAFDVLMAPIETPGAVVGKDALDGARLARPDCRGKHVWRAYADCFDGERLIRCGDIDAGLSLLHPAVDELWRAGFVPSHTPFGL
jgi:hypothetical protein